MMAEEQNRLNVAEEQNARERERRANEGNMVNLLNNVNDNTFRVLPRLRNKFLTLPTIFLVMMKQKQYVKHDAELASYEQVVDAYKNGENGVIMVGQRTKWHYIQLKRRLGRNYKKTLHPQMIVDNGE